MVTVLIPPSVIGDELRQHLPDKSRVMGTLPNLVHSPGCQRRFAVAIVILLRIGIDAVGNHAVGLLPVEHHSHVVLGQFRGKGGQGRGEAPAVPSPATHEIVHRETRDEPVVEQTTPLLPPVADECDDGLCRHAVVGGFHVGAYHLREIPSPAVSVGLPSRIGMGQ